MKNLTFYIPLPGFGKSYDCELHEGRFGHHHDKGNRNEFLTCSYKALFNPGEPGGGPRLRVQLLEAGAQQQEADPLHLLNPRQQAFPKAKINISPCLSIFIHIGLVLNFHTRSNII